VPIRSTPSPTGVGDALDGVGSAMGAVVQAVVIAATARSAGDETGTGRGRAASGVLSERLA
jgi:hypothetical protein